MRIAIVGGGVTGLTIASELVAKGHKVTVFEKSSIVGGLARGFPYPGLNGVYLDAFFHHIFDSDVEIVRLIEKHGLSDDLVWGVSKSGIVAEGRLWPFSTPVDLIKFTPLGSLQQRLFMGWNIRRFTTITRWEYLDKIRCREYFEGRWNLIGYKNLWEPLLKHKFGNRFDDISAAFLWGRIHPRARSRKRGVEVLGYLKGGFQRLFFSMADHIQESGGRILTGEMVREVKPADNPVIVSDRREERFERVVWTSSLDLLCKTVQDPTSNLVKAAQDVKYVGVTQLILVMRQSQSDFYWLNNVDPDVTFGAAIEHTNFIPSDEYQDEHILYIANYHDQGDERFENRTASKLLEYHRPSLEKIFSSFNSDDILRLYCIREKYSSPRYDLNFTAKIPPYSGLLKNVDICNMAQVYPVDRNMNNCAANALRYVNA